MSTSPIKFRTLFFLTFCTVIILSVEAQFSFTRYDSIKVIKNNAEMSIPWAGGINSAQFSHLDINLDGKMDLVSFDREGDKIIPLINIGNSGEIKYRTGYEYLNSFPKLEFWALFVDYNCDGKVDIFTSYNDGTRVYKNISNTTLQFIEVTQAIQDGSNSVVFPRYDIPAIKDIDNDGDIDILTFDLQGASVEWLRNMSMDLYGNCDSLVFQSAESCWGHFIEDAFSNNVSLGYSCRKGNLPEEWQHGSAGHSGSTILAFDVDGDRDQEVLMGDVSFPNMVLLTNGGDSLNANMTAKDTMFPSYDNPVNIFIFPAAFEVDIDNDGTGELLISPNNKSGSDNYKSVWLYKRTGLTSQPFVYVQNDFLQKDMIEVGASSNPALVDYNSDGLIDLVIGNYKYIEGLTEYASLSLFENTGTTEKPEFTFVTDDYLGLKVTGNLALYPAFGDLDNDGDTDLLLGTYDGRFWYFENKAGAGQTFSFKPPVIDFMNIDVGNFAMPQLADINNDNKLDMIVGEVRGELKYFPNIGTLQNPIFHKDSVITKFGGIDVEAKCCDGHSSPFLFNTNSGMKLMVGARNGTVYMYDNIENNLEGNFTLVDSLVTSGSRATIVGSDLFNNGTLTFLFGMGTGGIHVFKSNIQPTTGIEKIAINDIRVFPNPVREILYIQTDPHFTNNDNLRISIINNLGQVILQKAVTAHSETISVDLKDLSKGIYFVKFTGGTHTAVARILKE